MREYADINEIEAWLAAHLKAERCRHSLAVAETAVMLGSRLGLDNRKLRLAGLVHDLAKGLSDQLLLEIAEEQDLLTDDVERLVPDLLHAPVGAVMARQQFGIKDEEILAGIAAHTLGRPGMSNFEKILFLADMIEPGRSYPGRETLAALAETDLDAAMLSGLDSTIEHCLRRGRILHTRTVDTRNYFLRLINERAKED